MKKQNKTRLVILPEMIPYIIELYDKYYSNSIDKNIKDIGEELNYIFTDLFEDIADQSQSLSMNSKSNFSLMSVSILLEKIEKFMIPVAIYHIQQILCISWRHNRFNWYFYRMILHPINFL